MDFFEVLKQRHSIRAFTRVTVQPQDLRTILEAANGAPSAGNLQAYEIYLVKKQEARAALAAAALGQNFIAQAPVTLVFCAHPDRAAPRYRERGIRLYSIQDATIACAFAMLAATALGLATVWVGAFDDNAVGRAIGAPRNLLPVAILPIGYAGEKPGSTPRRRLQDLVHEV